MVTYHEHGGYRMDSSEIGVVLMVVGVCQLLWQVRSHCNLVPWHSSRRRLCSIRVLMVIFILDTLHSMSY